MFLFYETVFSFEYSKLIVHHEVPYTGCKIGFVSCRKVTDIVSRDKIFCFITHINVSMYHLIHSPICPHISSITSGPISLKHFKKLLLYVHMNDWLNIINITHVQFSYDSQQH